MSGLGYDNEAGMTGLAGPRGQENAMVRFASALALACITVLSSSDSRAEPRAVIELFTSQGCSSCPAADKLLAEYANDPSVIALSLAVDYWDYLGWKDTLALNGHTNRQRAYARARNDRQVYTPQAVIDGAVHALGSDKTAIERAIRQMQDQHSPLVLPVSLARDGNAMKVTVAQAKDGRSQAEVWLCPVSASVPVTIARGENSGRTVTYTNVVRRWIKLGDWTGKAETYSLQLKDIEDSGIDSAVVLVQSGAASTPKLMLGAAKLSLR